MTRMEPASQEFGRSREGRPLRVESYGTGPRSGLIIGGQHGDELPSVPLVTRFRDAVAAGSATFPEWTLHFFLVANPDGQVRGTRQNAAGVDLNRNLRFGWQPSEPGRRQYGGPAPESEPESVAFDRIVQTLRPERILTVHGFADLIDYDLPGGLALARAMAAENEMRVDLIGYPTPGSVGQYCTHFGIPLVTLELPRGRTDEEMWGWQRPALEAFIRAEI